MSRRLPHDVSPFLQRVRDILVGRPHISPIRFPERVAARTQPDPELPDGCNSKLANNYYYTRDGRRLVTPDQTLFVNSSSKPIALSGADNVNKAAKSLATVGKPKTPGKVFNPVFKNAE